MSCSKGKVDLDKIFQTFTEAKQMLPEDYTQCLKDLESLKYGYKAYPIGSRVLKLAVSNSDLDVFLDTGNMYGGENTQYSHELGDMVSLVGNQMRQNRNKFELDKILRYCRSPIITAKHISSVFCDISFRHGMGVENTDLILYFLGIVPIARPMLLFLKNRVKTNYHLNSWFGSYTLYVLVIFYMQQKNYLPTLVQLRPGNIATKKIGVWDCHFSKSAELLKDLSEPGDLLDLISGFCQFYLQFDFTSKVVCPLLGTPVLKSQFRSDGVGLPNEMIAYKRMVSSVTDSQRASNKQSRFLWTHPKYEIFTYDTQVCVQDLFDLSHNVTKAWKSHDLVHFNSLLSDIDQQCKATRLSADYDEVKWCGIDWSI